MIKRADELIERISLGDREALADLYEQHRIPLLSYIRMLTGDTELAEEILQDTLFAVWTGAGRFDGRSNGKTWLYGVARRRTRDVLRKRRVASSDVAAIEYLPSPDPQPEDSAIANEGADLLANALDRLLLIHREVLALLFVHGLSYQEISDILNVPIGTVKSRIFSAKRELRARLEEMEAEGL